MPTINATTFAKSYAEWKYCQYEKEKIQCTPHLDCPACFSTQHSVHVDGNKKLYRFNKVSRFDNYVNVRAKTDSEFTIRIS